MSNECHCPDPPGGLVRCGSDQMAICRVIDGRVESFCLSISDVQALATRLQDYEGRGVEELLDWLSDHAFFEARTVGGHPISRESLGRRAQKDRLLDSIRHGETIRIEGVATHVSVNPPRAMGSRLVVERETFKPAAGLRPVRVSVKMPETLAEHLREGLNLRAGV